MFHSLSNEVFLNKSSFFHEYLDFFFRNSICNPIYDEVRFVRQTFMPILIIFDLKQNIHTACGYNSFNYSCNCYTVTKLHLSIAQKYSNKRKQSYERDSIKVINAYTIYVLLLQGLDRLSKRRKYICWEMYSYKIFCKHRS